VQRELYAAMIVRIDELSEAHGTRLIQTYASLDVDGYWVRVANLSQDSPYTRVLEAAEFLFSLQAVSGRPVVLVGGGQLHLAFVASGIAGACIGIAENERFSYPAPAPRPGPRTLSAYHALLLRNFALNGRYAAETFRQHECDCGHHEPGLPPSTRDVKAHTLTLRLRDTAELGAGSTVAREERLRRRVEHARVAASWLSQEPPKVRTWLAVAAGAEGADRPARAL
jgi:hypothetical protein